MFISRTAATKMCAGSIPVARANQPLKLQQHDYSDNQPRGKEIGDTCTA